MVSINDSGDDLILTDLVVTDPSVVHAVREADDPDAFVLDALSLGVRALAAAGTTGQAHAISRAVADAAAAMEAATERAGRATDQAVARMESTTAESARSANRAVVEQVSRIFGGEHPELLDRLLPVLQRSGQALETQVTDAVRQAQADLNAQHDQRHADLLDRLAALRQDVAVREATRAVIDRTTLKGFPFEDQVNTVMADIAAGTGDVYTDTSDVVGTIAYCKKGDGVLAIDGGNSRIVIESHHGHTKDWSTYLPEAERNRGAAASIGVVASPDQNGGHVFRRFGTHRVIVAFDPTADDIDLLRAVVQMMRYLVLSTSARTGDVDLDTASAQLTEAVSALEDMSSVRKSFARIAGAAEDGQRSLERCEKAVRRALDRVALALGRADESDGPAETR